jgi:cyclase
MMKFRLIARLDIKKDRLIKGIHLEGLRDVGDPLIRAQLYYDQGIDELLLIDSVASLYQRNHLASVVKKICENIFVPITVGGGIRSIDDARALFDSGADKVAINTAALNRPNLLRELTNQFGAQAVVLSVQAKRDPLLPTSWTAMTDNGRENSGRSVLEWVGEAQSMGIGEILLTSIDQEGTRQGYDVQLITAVHLNCNCPVLASGGFAQPLDASKVHSAGGQAAVIASALHYDCFTVQNIKHELVSRDLEVRAS